MKMSSLQPHAQCALPLTCQCAESARDLLQPARESLHRRVAAGLYLNCAAHIKPRWQAREAATSPRVARHSPNPVRPAPDSTSMNKSRPIPDHSRPRPASNHWHRPACGSSEPRYPPAGPIARSPDAMLGGPARPGLSGWVGGPRQTLTRRLPAGGGPPQCGLQPHALAGVLGQ